MSEETQTTVDAAIKLVETAQSKGVFSLADAIKGRSYPKRDVVVYLDDEAAMLLSDINDQMSYSESEEELNKLQETADKLSERIKETSITFTLRGVNQTLVEEASKATDRQHNIPKNGNGTENPEWMRDYITRLISINIIGVRNAAGEEDNEPFTFERADELRGNLPTSEWAKLMQAMQQLTLAGGYFDQVTDAGFLPRF